jgi:hypothetical protein
MRWVTAGLSLPTGSAVAVGPNGADGVNDQRGRRSTVDGQRGRRGNGRRSTVNGVDGASVDGVDGATVDGVDGATVNGLTVDGVNGGRRSTGLTGFTANGVDGDNGASAGSGVRNGGGPAVLVGPDARGGLRGRTGRRRNACRLGRA